MALGISPAAFRDIVMPGIEAHMARVDKLRRTPEGREILAEEMERDADQLEQRALHPRYPLPPEVVKDTLKSVADKRKYARELRTIKGIQKGLYE